MRVMVGKERLDAEPIAPPSAPPQHLLGAQSGNNTAAITVLLLPRQHYDWHAGRDHLPTRQDGFSAIALLQ